jgi:hypothetical protein
MSTKNGHGPKPKKIEGVVHLNEQESKTLIEMVEQEGDTSGETYLRWMKEEAQRARNKRAKAAI